MGTTKKCMGGVTFIWHEKVPATRYKKIYIYIFEMLSSLNALCKNALFYSIKYCVINLWISTAIS